MSNDEQNDELRYALGAVAVVLGADPAAPILEDGASLSKATAAIIECAKALKNEHTAAEKTIADLRMDLTRVHAERVAADRRNVGLRRDLAKLLAEHGGAP